MKSKDGVILGGDMRADSPGHNAKYGSYTVMDIETGNVIDVQLVQVRFYSASEIHDRLC